MSELKPCPACHGPAATQLLSYATDEPWFTTFVGCVNSNCELGGPFRSCATEHESYAASVEAWNALPREERWVPVSEGLPGPDTGEEFELFIPEETVVVGCVRTEYWDGQIVWERLSCAFPVLGVTHWRPHTPPRGPEATDG